MQLPQQGSVASYGSRSITNLQQQFVVAFVSIDPLIVCKETTCV